MKKFAIALIASMAFVQSTYAATSALTQSILEYEAITTALGSNPEFEDVISPSQFITDIKRITPDVNVTGTIKYQIVTLIPGKKHDCSCTKKQVHYYIAKLLVEPNPDIGPFITTVVSIKEVKK